MVLVDATDEIYEQGVDMSTPRHQQQHDELS